MNIDHNDIMRLSHEIAIFLGKADLMTRLSTRAKLYLELPDIGLMCAAVAAFQRAISAHAMWGDVQPVALDEGTVQFDVGGVSIVLTCKQWFMTPSGKAVGSANVQIVSVEPVKVHLLKRKDTEE